MYSTQNNKQKLSNVTLIPECMVDLCWKINTNICRQPFTLIVIQHSFFWVDWSFYDWYCIFNFITGAQRGACTTTPGSQDDKQDFCRATGPRRHLVNVPKTVQDDKKKLTSQSNLGRTVPTINPQHQGKTRGIPQARKCCTMYSLVQRSQRQKEHRGIFDSHYHLQRV